MMTNRINYIKIMLCMKYSLYSFIEIVTYIYIYLYIIFICNKYNHQNVKHRALSNASELN